jgi:hypothetical protein
VVFVFSFHKKELDARATNRDIYYLFIKMLWKLGSLMYHKELSVLSVICHIQYKMSMLNLFFSSAQVMIMIIVELSHF